MNKRTLEEKLRFIKNRLYGLVKEVEDMIADERAR